MRPLSGYLVLVLWVFLPLTHGHAQELQAPPTRSAGVGVGIALASTIIPTVAGTAALMNDDRNAPGQLLLAYGWFIGPFPGNLYAGDKRRGLIGIGIRAAAFLLPVAAFSGTDGNWAENRSDGREMGMLAGILTTLGATAWNIWTIPASVRRYNESLSVGPTLLPDGALGLQVQLRW